MLKYRLITALLLLPILIGIIFLFPPLLFGCFMTIIVVLMMREWLYLSGVTQTPQVILGCVCIAVITLLTTFISALPLFSLALVFWLWACWLVRQYITHKSLVGLQHRAIHIIIGVLMFMCYWKAAVLLQQLSPRPWWLLYGIFLVWANDCGAYAFGRLWGKGGRLLAPTISPGKTWIGLWGGLLFGIIVTLIFNIFLPITGLQKLWLLLLSIPIILISILGDLFESMLKRHAGVKDSGELLPGHGGMLDRLDSTLAALPILALALMLCHVI